MIPIRDYSDYFETVVESIPELEAFHLVAEDNHAVNRLRDRRNVQLVLVIPNAQGSGEVGAHLDINTGYLFVLEKMSTSNSYDKELDQYEKTQRILLQIREQMESDAEDGCSPFWRLNIGSIQIDPEYNIFGGWNGYSMLFTF